MKMQKRYKIIICVLCITALVLTILSYLSWLGCNSQAARLIQILTALAIAVTAVIALSCADLPKQQVKGDIEPYITKDTTDWEVTHPKGNMTDELKQFFVNCSDPVISYKVQFKITNTSDFDWVKPVVTFWLPFEKQHPRKDKKNIWSSFGYHSNTYNTQVDLRILEMVDGVIISNSNLPYWKKNKHITIWIRMALENGGKDPFEVEVSVDCENSIGFAKTVDINPKELIENANKNNNIQE
jgi:hypothetical protein